MRDRRWIIIAVCPDSIVQLMGGWQTHTQLGLPSIREGADHTGNRVEFPHDMEVRDVAYDWHSKRILLRMYHHTFAEVPDGAQGPIYTTHHVYVRVVDIKGGTGEPNDPLIVEPTT